VTVVLGTALLAYFIYAPFEQVTQSQAAFTAPLWLSNIYFSFSDFNYFSPEAGNNLFLYTWSLAVEEQFYLLWPLVIFAFLIKIDTPLNKTGNKQRELLIGLSGLFIISLVICLYWSYVAPLLAFYLMPARGWQFALRGIIFLLANGNSTIHRKVESRNYYPLLAYLGICMIGLTMFYLDEQQVYPGFNAILPSLGAALLIYSGVAAFPHPLIRFLSLPCLQKIGDLSYSWYLWHWPILLLGLNIYPAAGLTVKTGLLILSLLLAQLTYSLVESPLRHYRLFTLRPALTILLAIILMSTTVIGIKGWELHSSQLARNP